MKNYYLHYDEKANINYSFLFALFCIAEKNKQEKLNNIIYYKSQKELAERLNKQCNYTISAATISRIIKDTKYLPYFNINKKENIIKLNTNFKKGMAANNKFIVLTEKEILFLLEQDNKQLNKYYLYLKYYCGYSKSKTIDTTANQILSAIGYSSNCGNNKENLCKFNNLLLTKGFINIKKIKDEKGYCRNIYSMKI